MMLVVLDTNIFISGLLWGGIPAQILEAAYNEQFLVLQTDALLQEVVITLSREKFANRLAQRQLSVAVIVKQLRIASIIVEPADIPFGVVRDPKDHHILACAVGGKAAYCVYCIRG